MGKNSNNAKTTNINNEKFYSKFFQDLESSKKKDDLLHLFTKYNLDRIDREKYPLIEYTIKKEEIKKLQDEGKITNECKLNRTLAKDDSLTPLEKLLYSMIWKNGDLGKESHIISGILGKNEKDGIVFNQIGKYLNNKNEIIIDQHVIRAYIFFSKNILTKNIYNNNCYKYLDGYKAWIKDNKLFFENRLLIDELLYSLGKKMKEDN